MNTWLRTIKRIKRFNLITSTLRSIEWWVTRGLLCLGLPVLLVGSQMPPPDFNVSTPVIVLTVGRGHQA